MFCALSQKIINNFEKKYIPYKSIKQFKEIQMALEGFLVDQAVFKELIKTVGTLF